ncbi:MAG: translation elongation factor Ts [Armatimonadota bacterium]|jgi:elongation factor Ts|nr:translation elongation factor Ts [Fimbriimonadaceae bacterium]MCZ8170384.1 translation elongation factor Ts [Brevundimonas sp.]
MAISASDVKRLREETDAPMMECKVALEEAGGDFEKAKAILREKGQSAAAKRSGRSTSEGVAKFVVSADGKTAVGVVLESETDFVSNNDGFRKLVDTLANGLLSAPADAVNGDANNVSIDGKTVAELVTEGVALFRENIQLTQAVKLETDGAIGVYNHHTGKQAAVVMVSGDAANAGEVATKGAIQAVAMGATYLTKAEVPQDIIAQEMELETQRAINDGKPAEMAAKIAEGRVNKEFFKSQVLLEQPFLEDESKSTAQFLKEMAQGTAEVTGFKRLTVGG